jgi:hypothetical protein
MRIKFTGLLAAIMLLCAASAFAQEAPQAKPELKGKYAIVVQNKLFDKWNGTKSKWPEVVDRLKEKYSAKVFKYDGLPLGNETLREELNEYSPFYVCFVSKPEHCERKFVKSVILFMRGIDSDPYDGPSTASANS